MAFPIPLKDIRPGGAGSRPGFSQGIVFRGNLLFLANDGVNGEELWSTDGTANGTQLLKDIYPSFFGSSSISELIALGDHVFFRADDGVNGVELWSTDGTSAGTRLVKDIAPGFLPPPFPPNIGRSSFPFLGTTFSGRLFFSADDGVNGHELWSSDGTSTGTLLVKDIFPGASPMVPGIGIPGGNSSYPEGLSVVGNHLLFWAEDDVNGRELWRVDSSLQTTLVKDINPGFADSRRSGVFSYSMKTAFGERLFFDANDGQTGMELWVSDGTAGGTRLLKEITPGSTGSYLKDPTELGGRLFFLDGSDLWSTDGTTDGTQLVKFIFPDFSGATGPLAFDWNIVAVVNGKLIVDIEQDNGGRQLWVSDGTTAGTQLLKVINPVRQVGNGLGNVTFATHKVVGNKVFFNANDGRSGDELWVSDGTTAGTRLVKDIRAGSVGSAPEELTEVGNRLFFWANDGIKGRELWSSDGTTGGTRLEADLNPGPAGSKTYSGSGSFGYSIKPLADKLILSANNGNVGSKLWALSTSTLSIAPLDASKVEGTGTIPTPFTFRVNRRGTTIGTSTVVWGVTGTSSNTANAADFSGGVLPGGTLTFAAGETSKTLTVEVAADSTVEATEGFRITLSAPTGATLGTATATGTLLNDDTALAITPLSAAKAEGRSGPNPFTFTVTRTGRLAGSSTALWTLTGTGANPTDAEDFTGPTSGTVSFSPGQSSRTITVNVHGDLQKEGEESFAVTLSAPTGATLATSTANATIRNDDLIGDAAPNTLVGTARAEFIDGRANRDTLTGGGAADVFAFRFSESPLNAPDRITDFAFGVDKIDLFSPTGTPLLAPTTFRRAANNATATTLQTLAAAVFADANGAVAGNQALGANGAVLVRSTNAAIAGTYLVINNATPARSDPDDLMIRLTGFSGSLPPLGGITPATVFV